MVAAFLKKGIFLRGTGGEAAAGLGTCSRAAKRPTKALQAPQGRAELRAAQWPGRRRRQAPKNNKKSPTLKNRAFLYI
ncbi:hypothetical protein SGRA_2955 [Saprospira grandis str. Lewin]|uniref:Uncharacterized protein n=1 Tax=Saprospira grandis (strain Lewin) TaxID=984262 RepID=H6LAU0_SAPGL|nr:hypothetical protein SGRA_2955 [Saprospira grandis str. Lewin]